VKKVQVALTKIPGVVHVNVSLESNSAVVKVAKGQVAVEQLTAAVETAGFKADSAKLPGAEEEITLSVAGMT
jgi:copper chaperone CopZ